MGDQISNCTVKVSTIFILDSPTFQTGANNIYEAKKGDIASSITGRLAPGVNHNVRLTFKTDFERMQYLIGLYGRSSQGLR